MTDTRPPSFTMSNDPSRKSRAMTWIASVLVVLLLYVTTWPVIYIEASPYRTLGPSGPMRMPPPWLQTVYRPMFFLYEPGGHHNPLRSYFQWWVQMIDGDDVVL